MFQFSFFSAPFVAVFGLFFCLLVLFFSLFFLVSSSGVVLFDWCLFSVSGVDFVFPVMIDKCSLVFGSVVVFISLSVMLFTVTYMSGDYLLEYFVYMVLLFVLSMNFLIFVPHLVFLLLGWDGLGLTSYLLVIYYQNDSSMGAGMVTVMTNRIGDSLLILSLSWCYFSGQWSLSFSSYHSFFLVCITVMVASMTKSAQVPFSAWLPAAMAAPTPVSSLVHSSTLVTAGVYLLIRFYYCLSSYSFFCYFIFFSGVVTCLMASLSAIYETDLKKVIALSTLSQLGVMMMSLGLGLPLLAFFHLVTHALFKALLFVCAGVIIHSKSNNQDVRLMGSIWSSMPVTSTCLNVANLSLCGFPFLAGFYSKDLIVESFMFVHLPVTTSVLLFFSVCFTSAYSVRLAIFSLWSPFNSPGVLVVNDESFFVFLSFFLLLGGAVCGGALFSWFLCPFVGILVLPFYLKVLTLFFIFLFGFLSFCLVELGVSWFGSFFLGSMWFLGFITSPPFVSLSFRLGHVFYVQELTWMELFSGKGSLGVFSFLSCIFQRSQGLSFSHLFSFITSVALLFFLVF